jgi:hypothetical protein
LLLQAYLGIAWAVGCCLFGALVASHSKECRISKQYLCQASLLLTGVSVMAFTAVRGYNGYVLFVWIYGLFYGGYSYSLKLYIYEKVRARNFARAWGFAQFSMAIPNAIGVPVAGYLSRSYGQPSGSYLSAISIILGGLLMSLIDLHKWNLRKRHSRHRSQYLSTKSSSRNGLVTLNDTNDADPASSHSRQPSEIQPEKSSVRSLVGSLVGSRPVSVAKQFERKMSFTDQDDFMPPISLLSHQRSFVYDDLIDDLKNGKPELSLFSEEEGIADMDLPDHLFIDDLEFLDNITSCDKVENCVMLSEYEQNLIKETESPMPTRKRKWSLFKQAGATAYDAPERTPVRPMIGVGGLRQSSFLAADNYPPPVSTSTGVGGVGRRRFLPKSSGASGGASLNIRDGLRELPVFPNTVYRRQQLPNSGPKRSITVIEESV